MRIKFNERKTEYPITSITNQGNVVTIKGDIPKTNTKGFILMKDKGTKVLDFSEYNTIYQVLPDGVQFSNDGSIALKDVTISVYWNDGDNIKEIRPESVTISVNGESVTLSDENNWKVSYKDVPTDDVYDISAPDVENYEVSISNTTITYSTDYILPEVPTLESRVADLEDATVELYGLIEG